MSFFLQVGQELAFLRESRRHWLQKTWPHLVDTISRPLCTIWKERNHNRCFTELWGSEGTSRDHPTPVKAGSLQQANKEFSFASLLAPLWFPRSVHYCCSNKPSSQCLPPPFPPLHMLLPSFTLEPTPALQASCLYHPTCPNGVVLFTFFPILPPIEKKTTRKTNDNVDPYLRVAIHANRTANSTRRPCCKGNKKKQTYIHQFHNTLRVTET